MVAVVKGLCVVLLTFCLYFVFIFHFLRRRFPILPSENSEKYHHKKERETDIDFVGAFIAVQGSTVLQQKVPTKRDREKKLAVSFFIT